MSLVEAVRAAISSLLANKTRSLLTMLGVIIGVAAVLVVVAIGEGLKADTLERIRSMGANLLTLTPGAGRGPTRRPGRLTDDDLEALREHVRNVAVIAPVVTTNGSAKYRNLTHPTQIIGATPEWLRAVSFKIADGRFITNADVMGRTRVAVLGSTVVDELFYGRHLLGEYIRINNIPFQVVGILEAKGGNADDQIVIPISTARQRLVGNAYYSRIYLSAASEAAVPGVIDQVKRTLYRLHRVTEETEDFRIRDQTEFLETMTETTSQMTMFVGGIALVSLLVGGVGIMNIMLVSVAERTREIGIRKAVGARAADILAQFLIESTLLSIIGGLIGIGLGFALSRSLGDSLGWQTVVPAWSVALSFLFSGAVGMFFGWYPARKAALLDPIECLRYE